MLVRRIYNFEIHEIISILFGRKKKMAARALATIILKCANDEFGRLDEMPSIDLSHLSMGEFHDFLTEIQKDMLRLSKSFGDGNHVQELWLKCAQYTFRVMNEFLSKTSCCIPEDVKSRLDLGKLALQLALEDSKKAAQVKGLYEIFIDTLISGLFRSSQKRRSVPKI